MSEAAPLVPVEQLPIPLFDGVVLAVRGPDGSISLSLRDLCGVLGLEYSAQRRRIRASSTMTLTAFRILVDRQVRTLDFLLLDSVSVWILSVQLSRVSDEQRQRFGYIQTYLIGAVQAAFAQLTGLPDAPGREIEDLAALDRIDTAFQQLAELAGRQSAIEESQDRARRVYRDVLASLDDLRTRVQQLELAAKSKLSSEQRGTVHRMVETWGERVAARNATQRGIEIRRCWRLVNERYHVATYTDLPSGKYDEIVQFIKQQCRAQTGTELDAAEQHGMEL